MHDACLLKIRRKHLGGHHPLTKESRVDWIVFRKHAGEPITAEEQALIKERFHQLSREEQASAKEGWQQTRQERQDKTKNCSLITATMTSTVNQMKMTIMKPFHPLYCSTLLAISAVFLALGDVTADTIVQEAYLKASNTDGGVGDWFGTSMALDGDRLVVGAGLEDSSARGVNGNQSDNTSDGAGAAYVFVLSASPKILAIDQIGGEVEIRYHGILQKSADLPDWTDLDPQPTSPYRFTPSLPREYYRAREE